MIGALACCFYFEMKSQHSNSLILVWRVAEFEARHCRKRPTIEPTHLLLGLCKVVDLDLPEFVSKDAPDRNEVLEELLREVRKLRTVFRAAGLDAKTFRRNCAGLCPNRDSPWTIQNDCAGARQPSKFSPMRSNSLNSAAARFIPSICFTRLCLRRTNIATRHWPN